MKNYAKIGLSRIDKQMSSRVEENGKQRRPGYRTPAVFKNRILRIVSKIPKGKTLTYKDVAEKAGNWRAYRAVGNILNKNLDPKIPCHRVIRSDGKTGGYNRGSEMKIKILRREGAIK